MKYDKVVEMNQKIGKQNARIVEKEIERMIENGERVTVAALQRYTGFSNWIPSEKRIRGISA